jgi:OmpA-OmpF porin, OOP family
MSDKFTRALCAVITVLILATNVHAVTESTAFSISLTGGGYSSDISGTTSVAGVKLGYDIIGQDISDSLGIEAGFSAVSTKSNGDSNTKDLYLYRIDAIYPFMPRKRLVPYIALGVGGCSGCGGTSASNALLGNYGFGVRYFLTENIAFRTDFRQLIISDGGKSNNLEYTAGLTYYFSKDKQLVRIPVIDSDHDGVPDDKDACPNTPRGVKVDAVGCPLDSDKDGVPDYKDKCPDTPSGTKVGADGCPVVLTPAKPVEAVKESLPEVTAKVIPPEKPAALPAPVAVTGALPAAVGPGTPGAAPDSGKATIYTSKEPPPEQKITAATTTGDVAPPPVPPQALPAAPAAQPQPIMAIVPPPQPPSTKKPVTCPTLPDKDLVASFAGREQVVVEFGSDSAVLQRKYYAALKDVRKRLKENSSLKVVIEGHADYRGSPAYNLTLSRQRALAVKSFLIRDRKVVAANITIKAFGCTVPIDDNRTVKGRQKNRRAVVLTIKTTQ